MVARPNILLFVADDIGQDQIALYGVAPNNAEAPTPNFDALAQRGVRFTKTHSYPFCSPTRACFLTGRYGFRTGVGQLVRGDTRPLLAAEICLPRAMRRGTDDAYRMGAFGKWHIANFANDDVRHPTNCGFDVFKGTMRNIQGSADYFNWPKVSSWRSRTSAAGKLIEETCHEYAITQVVDDALEFIHDSGRDPWFAYVPIHAPHEPWHRPPAHLYDATLYPLLHQNPDLGSGESRVPYFKAMVMAQDREFGRLLAGIPTDVLANTWIIWLGDNGTSELVVAEEYPTFPPGLDSTHAKLSVYELGINVPMVVAGPGVSQQGRTNGGLVDTVDIFTTIMDLVGVPLPDTGIVNATLDGVSFKGILNGSSALGTRTSGYSELFIPNGPNTLSGVGGLAAGQRAIYNRTVKLLKRNNGALPLEELYDLAVDPQETNDLLLAPLVPPYVGLYNGLLAAFNALLV